MSLLFFYFRDFLSNQHIPYSYDLWLDFADWFYDCYGENNISNLTAVDTWFSQNKEYLISKAKDEHFKTWKSVCAGRYSSDTMGQLFEEYFQLHISTPKDISAADGLNRYKRMKNFLSLHENTISTSATGS
jgi:hypothetical protein